jgi:hypothetical protein
LRVAEEHGERCVGEVPIWSADEAALEWCVSARCADGGDRADGTG